VITGASAGLLRALVLAFISSFAFAHSVAAVIWGGGGIVSNDCLAVFDANINSPAARPSSVRCVDGEVGCDLDGSVNGVCEFPVTLCVNSTFDDRCTLRGVQSVTVNNAIDDGDPKFDPDFLALQDGIDNDIALPTAVDDTCMAMPSVVHVPIRGPFGPPGRHYCIQNMKIVRVKTVSQLLSGKVHTDLDMIRFACVPASKDLGGCDPRTLFTGTFERIQRQVFNQTCAVSSCHDSQSQSGGLLLEAGASLTNLINKDPTNEAALADLWKRATVLGPTSGDPSTSFLYRKITATLPSTAYGKRMPLNRAPVERNLREAIRIWIENGAPDAGWLDGTD
jgi:hypothetical protein